MLPNTDTHLSPFSPNSHFSIYLPSAEPLPVTSVSIYDYKPSPETGVLFEIHYPEKYNVFTRVNISYWEGKDFRTMLYKGKRQKEGCINDGYSFLHDFCQLAFSLALKRSYDSLLDHK